jgi:hypothetical protein
VPLQITCSMMLGMRAFLALLMLLVCASAHAQDAQFLETIANWDKGLKVDTPSKTVLQNELGGAIDQHWRRFTLLLASGDQVEVRGKCQSACTLITARIPKNRLCFAADAHLAFHWSRLVSGDGPVSREATQWMLDRYPEDIRAWIDALGGIDKLPQTGYWVLPASTLWSMGYRRCGA